MKRKLLQIVYASDLTIKDPSLLATLVVFYDKVYLPHPYDLDPNATPLARWPMKHLDELEFVQSYYRKWTDRWQLLLEAGVFEVLPPAFQATGQEPVDLQAQLLEKLGIKVPFFGSSDFFDGRVALAMHALFTKTSDPEFLFGRSGATSTDHLREVLATSLFQYRIPKILETSPEQLLKIRAQTESDKEGFVYYLDQLIDDVEGRLKASIGDEREAALRTIERKIIPDLEEHLAKKKLEAEKTLVKALRFVAKGVETSLGVFFAPWNFKNYTGASQLILDGADALIENKLQQVGNQHRAFQFLASFEERRS